MLLKVSQLAQESTRVFSPPVDAFRGLLAKEGPLDFADLLVFQPARKLTGAANSCTMATAMVCLLSEKYRSNKLHSARDRHVASALLHKLMPMLAGEEALLLDNAAQLLREQMNLF